MDAKKLPVHCHHMSLEMVDLPDRGPHLVCRFRDGSSGCVIAQMCMREAQAGGLASFLAPPGREVTLGDEDVDAPEPAPLLRKDKGPATSTDQVMEGRVVVESKGKRYASYWRSGGQGSQYGKSDGKTDEDLSSMYGSTVDVGVSFYTGSGKVDPSGRKASINVAKAPVPVVLGKLVPVAKIKSLVEGDRSSYDTRVRAALAASV